MKIEFGIFLRVRRDRDRNEAPEEIVSAASTTASQTDLAEDWPREIVVRRRPRFGFQAGGSR